MKRKTFSSAGPCLDATVAGALVFLAGMVLKEGWQRRKKEKRGEGGKGDKKEHLVGFCLFLWVGRYTSHVLS